MMAEAAATDWIEHDGGDCPVDPETPVLIRMAGGMSYSMSDPAGYWLPSDCDQFNYWTGRGGHRESQKRPTDRIIAYRVVSA